MHTHRAHVQTLQRGWASTDPWLRPHPSLSSTPRGTHSGPASRSPCWEVGLSSFVLFKFLAISCSLKHPTPEDWERAGGKGSREGPYVLVRICPGQVTPLTALCAFSHSLLISPLLPHQINMIIAMLQMRGVRLRKITWPPRGHPGGEARDFRPELAVCRKRRFSPVWQAEEPSPVPREKEAPGWVEGRRLAPAPLRAFQGGKCGQSQLFGAPGGWASQALAPLLAGEEQGVIIRRPTRVWRGSSSPTTQSALRGTGWSWQHAVDRGTQEGGKG